MTKSYVQTFYCTTKKLRPIVIDNYETLLYVYIQIYKYINKYVMDISLSGGRLWAYTAREIIVEGVARDYYLKGGIRP